MVNNIYAPESYPKFERKSVFRTSLTRYRRNWFWFMLSVSIMIALPIIYQYVELPVYKSRASLLITNTHSKNPFSEPRALQASHSPAVSGVENEIGILKSYFLMERVVTKLGLQARYFSVENPRTEIYAESPVHLLVEKSTPELFTNSLELTVIDHQRVILNGRVYPVDKSITTPYGQLRVVSNLSIKDKRQSVLVKIGSPAKTITGYLAKLTVEPPSNQSGIVGISLVDAVPKRGEDILNQLIHEFSWEANQQKQKEADHLLDSIDDRLMLIADEPAKSVKESKKDVALAGTLVQDSQMQDFLAAIQKNDVQLKEVDYKLNSLDALEKALQVQVGAKGFVQTASIFREPQLVHWVNQMLKYEDRILKIEDNSTDHRLLASQVKLIKANISVTIDSIRKELVETRDQLVTSNRRVENGLHQILRKGRTLLSIFEHKDVKRSLYRYLLKKREEAALTARTAILDSRVIDVAWTDEVPEESVQKFVYFLCGFLGLLVPIAWIGVKDVLHNRVLHFTDVEEYTQAPIIGAVAYSRRLEADNLVFKPHLQSVMGEQIRVLRTNLQFLKDVSAQNQLILVTSCLSGEGKSLISLNLGASFSLISRPTIILEMDMRKPQLHKSLHLENQVGISTYLLGEASIDEIVHPVFGFDNYFIATAGPVPPNPAELLYSKRLGQLFYELKERFDFIIVDTPPIGLVTDAQLIARFADSTLFVVRQNFTPRNCLRFINRFYKTQRFQNLNIVLNAVGNGELFYDQDYGRAYMTDSVKVSSS